MRTGRGVCVRNVRAELWRFLTGCVRLWDMKYAGDDPRNGEVLVRCDYDVATFTLGNMYEGEAPIVV